MKSTLLLLCAFVMGCGANTFTSSIASPPGPTAPSPLPFTELHAYGDSITYGVQLSDPSTQDYIHLASSALTLPLTNRALSTEMGCDISNHQIFPNQDSPTLATRRLYSLLVSTNDVGTAGTGPAENVFNLCQQASIGWLAVPLEMKTLATAASVKTTGQTHLETANNWNALYTDTQGSTISFTLTLSTAGPVYIWYRDIDWNFGNWTYSLDGTVLGTGSTGTIPTMHTSNNTNDSLAFLRLANIAAGSHTLTFTQQNTQAAGFGVVAVAVPVPSGQLNLPRVLVGTTPRQLNTGVGSCATNDSICQAYIADITANVKVFATDGLDVRLFDDRKYTTGTVTDMADSVHPNVTGHQEFFKAFMEVAQ